MRAPNSSGAARRNKTARYASPLAGALLLPLAPLAEAQSVLPQGGNVVSGLARIGAPSGNTLTITQNSPRAIIDWTGFSIGQNAGVNFVQPNASSAILNRVIGSTPSTIAGQLTGNGQVFLVNPNGIAITPTGAVQVGGGFIASTLDIGNADFNAGNLSFAGKGASAGVSNAGVITSAPGGFVGLIGGTVSNAGTITVPLGKVGLGSGEQATINPTGDGFLQVALPTGAVAADGHALVDISGRIRAAGGSVEIRAATARQAVRDAVNVSGSLSARSVSGRNGSIVLDGGAGGNVNVLGKLSAAGGKQAKGGAITITGNSIGLRGALVDVSGGTGGGSIQIGGGPRGTGPLLQAATASVDPTSSIRADATGNGDGGTITVWSNGATSFAGSIAAQGGPQGGNGGQAEVSSHGLLDFTGSVNTLAPKGRTGSLLLDPYDVTIQAAAGVPSVSCSGGVCSPSANDSILTVATLQSALTSSDVIVDTGAGGGQAGNISVNDPVTWSTNYGLTLSAAGGITVASGASITATGGGSLNLTAAAGAVSVTGATLSTNGGNLGISAPSAGSANAITLTDANVSVGTGTGTISGTSTSGNGVVFAGATVLGSSGAGALAINGSSDSGKGIVLASGASITSSGSVTLSGSSNTGTEISFTGSNSVTDSGGDLTFTGTSSSYRGVEFWNAISLTNTGAGTLSLSGTTSSASINNAGLEFNHLTTMTTSGTVALSGSATSSPGVGFDASTVTNAGGDLTISGTSGSGVGTSFYLGSSFTNNGAGTMTVTGTSGSGPGIVFSNAGATSLTTSGAVALTGQSTSGSGFVLDGNATLTQSSGNLTISGTTASGSQLGIDMSSGGNTITNNGSGTLTLNGTGGDNLAATIASASGDVVISDTAAVTQSGGTITAANLLLSGTGSFGFGQANMIGTLAANVGSVSFNNNQALAIGTVQATSGITATGAVTVTAAGDLSIAPGAMINGASPVLATTAAFVNNSGSNAVNATSGRWLIYSSAPGSDTFGSLNSNNNAIWNATYAGLPPGNVAASGSHYLFATQPTLTFTSSNATKTYGADVTGSISGDYTLSGLQSGVANAFLADSAATVFTGAPSVTSTGAVASAGVAGSPYAMTIAQGSVTATSGYAFAFQSNGQLTVNPASVNVTALGGFSTYGSSPANPGLSATGLQNGQGVGVLTGLSNSFGITNASNAGDYTLSVAGSLNNANYTVAGTTNGTWTVNPASVTVTALGGFSTYGSSPANPGLSATGLQNGQGVSVLTGLSNSFGITNASNAGGYALTVAGSLTNTNYTLAGTTNGTWTVNPASVTVTALGGFSTYGSSPANPGLSATGLQNGQSVGVLTGLSNSFGITNASNAGDYTLSVAGSLTNTNYSLAGTNSVTWTVNPASVTVTALGGSSVYGSSPANPGLSATGLQNGQSVGVLTGLSNSFGITNASNAGGYTLSVAGSLTNTNYSLAGTNSGTWTVNPAPVSITALGGSSIYGSSPSNPGLSATGLQNGQGIGALTGLSNSFGISNTSNAGDYTLSVAGALTNANYTIASANHGTWTVNPAPVSVTALGGSSTYGASPADPGLSATGLQNGDSVSALTGLRNSFGITNASLAGSYTLNVAGALTNANYTVTTTNTGTWTVLRGSLPIGSSPSGQTPPPPSPPPASASSGALNAVANAPRGPNPISNAAVRSSAASAAVGANAPFTPIATPGVAPAASVVNNTPAAAPLRGPLPAMVAAATPGGKTHCAGDAGGTAEWANDAEPAGPSSTTCAPSAPTKVAGLIDFALSKLNRGALVDALNREFSDVRHPTTATRTALTTLAAGTSLALTTGLVGWLLRGGALLSALLSSMPLWRGIDPLMIVLRPKRDDEQDQPPSDVDQMFDDAQTLQYST